MKRENQAVRERLERAVMSGDKEGARACLAPDLIVHQAKGHPYGGVYKGADGFMALIERMMSDYAIEGLEGTNAFWADNPDHAVFEFKIRGKAKASGQKFDTTILEYWQFRDGKVSSILPCWFEIPD